MIQFIYLTSVNYVAFFVYIQNIKIKPFSFRFPESFGDLI